MILYVISVIVWATALAANGRAFSSSGQHRFWMRRLLQEDVATGIRVADFSMLPPNLTAVVEYDVPETQLKGSINISATDSHQVSYGTYSLGPDQVKQLNATISAEMVRFCTRISSLPDALGTVCRAPPGRPGNPRKLTCQA